MDLEPSAGLLDGVSSESVWKVEEEEEEEEADEEELLSLLLLLQMIS